MLPAVGLADRPKRGEHQRRTMKSSGTLGDLDLDWAALLRNTQVVNLDDVRNMQEAHRRLFRFEGPPAIAAFVRMFRLIGLFGHFAMSQKRFPVLNRAWADLQWILRNPDADEFSVASWAFLDLPVTDDGRTVAELFRAEIAPNHAEVGAFVDMTRASRYGIYVDDGGTRRSHRLRELVTGRRVTVTRGVDSEDGELFWTRIIDFGGMSFMLGDTRGWPPSQLATVTDMLIARLSAPRWMTAAASVADAYQNFMKMAGPYWLSMLYARSDHDPLLEPDHYLSYGRGTVPDLAPPHRE